MSTLTPNGTVLELRVALTTSDYERLAKFYCDGLGIEPTANWENNGSRALMLEMQIALFQVPEGGNQGQ